MAATFDTTFWTTRLREGGLRATPSRLEVVRVLSASPSPLNAQQVLDAIGAEHADRVTVYRTLNSLVARGLAHKLDPGDRVWRYGLLLRESAPAKMRPASEEREPQPAIPAHGHAHFVCDACGTVRCLDDATLTIRMNPKGRARGGGGKTEKFRLSQRDALLRGTCGECLHEKPPKRA